MAQDPTAFLAQLAARRAGQHFTHFVGLQPNCEIEGSYIGLFMSAEGELTNLPQQDWPVWQAYHISVLDKASPSQHLTARLADPERFETLLREQVCFELANEELVACLEHDLKLAETSPVVMSKKLLRRLGQTISPKKLGFFPPRSGPAI